MLGMFLKLGGTINSFHNRLCLALGMQIICFDDRLQVKVVMRIVEWSLDCWKQSVSQQLGSIQ